MMVTTRLDRQILELEEHNIVSPRFMMAERLFSFQLRIVTIIHCVGALATSGGPIKLQTEDMSLQFMLPFMITLPKERTLGKASKPV